MGVDRQRTASGLEYTQDPYLLRRLLRCSVCDLWLGCTRALGSRVYRCAFVACDLTIDATDADSRTLAEAQKRAAIDLIQPEYRQSALRQLLLAAIAGPGRAIEWRWRTGLPHL